MTDYYRWTLDEKEKELLRDLTTEQKWAIRKAFKLWVYTARNEGYRPIELWVNFEAEVDHSALLERTLLGKDPLTNSPPKSFSYPNYSLVEKESEEKCEVHPLDVSTIVINQARWKIVNKISDDEYLVVWDEDYPLHRVSKVDDSTFGWRIEKIDD